MDPKELTKAFEALQIPKNHATVGVSNLIASNKQYRSLFVNRRLPDHGWSDIQIQNLLFMFSLLDTNNKSLAIGGGGGGGGGDNAATENEGGGGGGGGGETRWCGVGEREGRVYSSLVQHRHFGLSHGMGRSGDITEPQPKAAGSSVLVKLALLFTLDVLRRGSGLDPKGSAKHGILLPLCTGMSMSLLLSSLRSSSSDSISNNNNNNNNTDDDSGEATTKNIVLWSRIDQKSCFKAITSAGLKCVVVETKMNDDEVVTDIEAMETALQKYGSNKVLAVITTASCFAPRVPDSVDEVAKLCNKFGVYHVINNAYGLQCAKTSKLINRACVVGRVDGIVCSTDKNFLVPVGGAIIVSPNKTVIENVGKVYAGRASSSPIVDLFITLLSMGMNGYKKLLADRVTMMEKFPQRFHSVASKFGERVLNCPANTISFGMTLDGLARPKRDDETDGEYTKSVDKEISSFGSMLFSRCVSGTRVVPRAQIKIMGGHEFVGFGSSTSNYNHAYMTAAVAIGVSPAEIDEFLIRLEKTLTEFYSKKKKKGKNEKNQ